MTLIGFKWLSNKNTKITCYISRPYITNLNKNFYVSKPEFIREDTSTFSLELRDLTSVDLIKTKTMKYT